MKKVSLSVFLLLCCTFFILSCKKSEDTTPPSNQQPTTPSSPSPSDAEANVSITPVLSWTCSDPDAGDSLKYDIYFGSINPPNTLLVSNWKQPNFALSTLDFNTTYYWRVTAHDLKGAAAVGPIWRFTTLSELPIQGLVAYYPFNGNANDESGNSHHGSVHGATLTEDRFGNANRAYNFDGVSNYIQCNSFPLLNSTFSYVVWIKVTRSSGLDINNNFGCFGTTGGGVSTWDFAYNVTKQWFAIFDKTNSGNNYSTTIGNVWNFVVVKYSGTSRSIYLNGSLFGTPQNITTPISSLTSDFLRIGSHTNDGSQQFMGSIDDIRIYNRELSDAEIQILYHEGGWSK